MTTHDRTRLTGWLRRSYVNGVKVLMTERNQHVYTLKQPKPAFWNERRFAWMAFITPLLFLAIAYAISGVFPFGSSGILTVDLFHQYAPFLNLYREHILHGETLMYASEIGLGTNFFAIFAYYLASPLNLLLIIFPKSMLTEGVLLITLLKVGLMGWTFHRFLRIRFGRRGGLAVAFATFYALSGYIMAYGWNIMWLDALILMPLVIAELILLIQGKRWYLFPMLVGLMLITNFYAAFFACVFIVLYTPILLVECLPDAKAHERWKTIGKVIGSALLGVAMAAVILWPTYRALQLTSAADNAFPEAKVLGQPLVYLTQLFPFLEPTVRSGAPNLYAGLPILWLVPVYFLSKRVRMQSKLLNGALLLFMLLSFDFNVFDFLWHGTHFPNQLPYRYSFVLIFLLLTIAYDGLRSLREFKAKELGFMGLAWMLLIPTLLVVVPDVKTSSWSMWGGVILMGIYTMLLVASRHRVLRSRVFARALISVMMVEILLSSMSGVHLLRVNESFGQRESYATGTDVASIRDVIDHVDTLHAEDDFYRMELRPHKSSNDPALYGYNGVSIFASSLPKAPVDTMKHLGFCNNGINSFQYRGATLFTDALFRVKYVMRRDEAHVDESARPVVLGNEYVTLHEVPYVCPLGFVADPDIIEWRSERAGGAFVVQNNLANALTGETLPLFDLGNDLFHAEDSSGVTQGDVGHFTRDQSTNATKSTLRWTAPATGPCYLYLDVSRSAIEKIYVKTDGESYWLNRKAEGVHELGTLQQGDPIFLSIEWKKNTSSKVAFEAYTATLNMDTLQRFTQITEARGMTLSRHRQGRIDGTVNADRAGTLMLSIPYNPGWSATVDGEAVRPLAIDNAMLGLPVAAGHHDIVLRFMPVGFWVGLIVTLAALAVWGMLFFLFRYRAQPKKRKKQRSQAKLKRAPKSAEHFPEAPTAPTSHPTAEHTPWFLEDEGHTKASDTRPKIRTARTVDNNDPSDPVLR